MVVENLRNTALVAPGNNLFSVTEKKVSGIYCMRGFCSSIDAVTKSIVTKQKPFEVWGNVI